MDTQPVRMLAQFKPIEGAFTLDGEGDGGKLTLVFDRAQVAPAVEAWVRFAGGLFVLTFGDEGD